MWLNLGGLWEGGGWTARLALRVSGGDGASPVLAP